MPAGVPGKVMLRMVLAHGVNAHVAASKVSKARMFLLVAIFEYSYTWTGTSPSQLLYSNFTFYSNIIQLVL